MADLPFNHGDGYTAIAGKIKSLVEDVSQRVSNGEIDENFAEHILRVFREITLVCSNYGQTIEEKTASDKRNPSVHF